MCTVFFKLQKTPFASTNANSELGKFYREWQSAPTLQAFSDNNPELDENELTKQLEAFESELSDHDKLLHELCLPV